MPYPTAPSRRIAWHKDGTVAMYRDKTNAIAFSQLNSTQMTELNDEDEVSSGLQACQTGVFGFATEIAFLFPELREFDGFFESFVPTLPTSSAIDSSAGTTNGIDGTWVNRISNFGSSGNTYNAGAYRNNVQSLAVAAIRGVRTDANGANGFWKTIHLYGEISPGETPDRVLFIDELTGLEFTLPKDYGDIPRGSARIFDFRLKNNSTVAGNNVTLDNVQFTADAPYLGSDAWYEFSVGGDAYAATKQLTSLAPEASSSLINCKQVIPAGATPSLHAAFIEAAVGGLS